MPADALAETAKKEEYGGQGWSLQFPTLRVLLQGAAEKLLRREEEGTNERTMAYALDVGKAVASVEADRVRELGHVKEQVGVIPANCKAKGAIVAANHTMGVVPVLHATATRSLDPIRALDAQHGPALLASAAIGLVESVELLLASAGAQEIAGQVRVRVRVRVRDRDITV